jgi:hypothetical protein
MLSSTTNYRVKVSRGRHSGYEIKIEQECFFLWLFRFWSVARITQATTITYAAHLIIKMEHVYGAMEIIDYTNSLAS